MSTSKPGVVFCKEHSDLPEKEFDILKHDWSPEKDDLPDIIPPRGLSADRQWYLYEQIRPYCPDEDKDTTCPKPRVPKPGRSTPDPEQEGGDPGPPKRRRTCTGVWHTNFQSFFHVSPYFCYSILFFSFTSYG